MVCDVDFAKYMELLQCRATTEFLRPPCSRVFMDPIRPMAK